MKLLVGCSTRARIPTLATSSKLRQGSKRNSSTNTLQDELRQLMVHCTQSVGVVTTRMREREAADDALSQYKPHDFHGATISSFSSIALHPYPLVAFSLQLPSRMATSIRERLQHLKSYHHHHQNLYGVEDIKPHMVINLLSDKQDDIALRFSRPDRYPEPFANSSLFRTRHTGDDTWRALLTREHQPMLEDCVGCISCAVVQSVRLDGRGVDEDDSNPLSVRDANSPDPSSELFIARVMRLESLRHVNGPPAPLVYYQKQFTTIQKPAQDA